MNEMPVVRATYVMPFIHYLNTIGAPVKSVLIRAKLPLELEASGEMAGHVPLENSSKLLTYSTHSQGIEDIGLRVFGRMDLFRCSPDLFGAISNVASLKTALELFCRLAVIEDSTLRCKMVYDEDDVYVRTRLDFHTTPEHQRASEWTRNLLLISIVRHFAGSSWYPEKMAFESNAPLSPYAMGRLPNTTIFIDRKTSWVKIPKHMLSLPPKYEEIDSDILSKRQSEEPNGWDLTSSVSAILPSYLCDGTPNINLIAEFSEMSLRTFQRRLGEEGTNFSELVEKARYKKSIDLLVEPNNKIIDIAYSLGYLNHSHFSRAFRRYAGVSPLQFRQQQFT